jgi:hypothetical protein
MQGAQAQVLPRRKKRSRTEEGAKEATNWRSVVGDVFCSSDKGLFSLQKILQKFSRFPDTYMKH